MRKRHGAPHERSRPWRPVARLLAVTIFAAAILPASAGGAQAQTQSYLGVPGAAPYQDLGGPPDLGGPGLGPPVLEIPSLSVADKTVDEDDGTITVTVSLSSTSVDEVTVQYATSNGTATAGIDYTGSSGTLTFPAGDTSKTVSVSIIDDTLDEVNETFKVTLSNPTNDVTISDNEATVTITDDDDPPSLRVADKTVDEDAGSVTLTVTLGRVSSKTVTVDYATSSGTATAGIDYTDTSGSLSFAPGDRSKTVSVSITDDNVDENSEAFTFTLSNPNNASISDNEATVTITDNDTASLSAADKTVSEGAGSVTLTVSLSAEKAVEVTVNYATSNGTATAGNDYTAKSGSLSFSPGETSKTVTVSITNDSLDEANETFKFKLSNPSNASISDNEATVTINNDDAPSLSVGAKTVNEDAGSVTLTVSLSAASVNTVTADYATSDGTATAGSDYTTKSGSLSFSPSQTSKTVTVSITDDNLDEDDETFRFTLSNLRNVSNTGAEATVTITDDDTASLSVADVSVSEGAGSVTLTVSLGAESSETVTVDYATSNGTATAGSDYTTKSGSLSFSPGDTSETVTVSITDDSLDEDNETFTFNLSNPDKASISDSQATVTINDNDPAPSLSVADVTVKEGAGNATLTVSMDAVSSKTVTVNYATSDGTAKNLNPIDYIATSGTLTIPRGDQSATVPVPINSDSVNESNETFRFTISSPSNATISRSQATVTITDNPTLTVADVSVDEPDNSVGTTVNATLTVSLDVEGAADVEVDYWTLDGSGERGANAGDDYTGLSRTTLTISAGQRSGTVTVPILHDTTDEWDEKFEFSLHNPTNASISDSSATVTIDDNDPAPSLSVADLTVKEGTGTAALTVTLSAASGKTVTVRYATSNGTAAAGSDYTARTATLTFRPGDTTKTVSVPINSDTVNENDETFRFTLSSPSNATISRSQATVTIEDNPTLTIGDMSVGEPTNSVGGTVNVTLTVSLDVAGAADVKVFYLTRNGVGEEGANAGSDYTLTSGTLTVTAGQMSGTVTVPIRHDTTDEWDETFEFRLSNPRNASISDSSATVTITDNDDPPSLSVADKTADEDDGSTRLTVSLDAASGKTITVNYATSNGTTERDATAGSDYSAESGSRTFSPGQTTRTVRVLIAEDTTDEWNETFTFTLSGAVNADIGDSSATVTINDNDPPPSLSMTGGTVSEAIGSATLTVRLSAASGRTITVNYATADGTGSNGARAPGDYTATSGTLTFTPGQTSKTVSVPIISDAADEDDETFTVALSNPVNVTGTPSATITIGDNPTLSISDVETNEADRTAVFTVTLDAVGAFQLTVDYATSDGSAEAPGDYTRTVGTLTIPAGTSSRNVSVPIVDDSDHELHETFTITLSNPSNSSLSVSSAEALIFDNDTPDDEPREVFAVFVVRLSAASAQDVSVDYTTVDGTATAGVDYTETSGTLTIPAGSRQGTIRVPIIGDITEGVNRMFSLRLSNPRNAVLRDTQADAAATILDDDIVPRLMIGDATAPEGGVATFPVTLSTPGDEVVTLDWATVDDTAEGGTDYVSRRGRLTIPRGQTEATIRIRVRDDRSEEPDETFMLRVIGATNARRPAEPATGTILDDDATPILTVTGATVPEDAGFVEFAVSLNTPSGRFVTADFRTSGGTATAGVDYTATTGTLIIPPGWASVVVRVPISDDSHDEGDETFTLRLRNARHATLGDGTATATIADDDGLPSLAVADAGATEGTGAVTFTVTLSEARSTNVSASYFTLGGTARSSLDFRRTSGTLTIPAGETTASIRVPIIADQRDEPAETFTLTLSRPVGASAPAGPATGTIVDRPTLLVAPAAASESAGPVSFTVTLDAVSHEDVSVDYATAGGTATSGVDFRRTSGTLTIPAGDTTAAIQVPVIADRRAEPAETFTLTLRAPRNAALGDGAASATGTIVDDDGLPRLSVADVTAAEGDGGLTFTVTLDGAARRDVSVDYATVAGTATRRLDFSPVRGRLTIPAGSGAATIRVPIVDDSLDEPAETFTLTLAAPRNAALGDGAASATGTIVDDDGPPHLSVADVTAPEGNAAVMFTVTLDAASSNDVTVDYATSDGTATAGEDYTAVSGTLTVPAGETAAKISVPVLDDSLDEPDETFTLTLSGAQNAVAPRGPITATIVDDEIGPSITVDDLVVPASSEVVTFTVSLSAPTGQVVRVDYRAVEAAAGAGTGTAGTLTIPAGETTAQIEIPVGDGGGGAAGTRQITLTLSNARNATLGDATATATITRLPILAVAPATAEEGSGSVTVTVSLSAARDVDVRVRYATVSGTASRRDYRARSGMLTIPAGRLSADIVVSLTDDSLDEPDETFTLVLTDARNAAAPAGPATITIVDDDGLPTIEIGDVTVQEGRHTP